MSRRAAGGKRCFFATCAPGIEPVLHEEVRALKLARSERQVGGVYFEGGLEAARRANLWLGTAIRVLMRVERFPCSDDMTLYRQAKEVAWERFLSPEGTFIVDAQTRDSELNHSRFLEQRVKDAIVDRFREATGRRPSVEREGAHLGVHVHLFRDRATLSVDTSGHALHRRGWRRHQGRAPLAETLAMALVRMSGWDGRAPLLDPFCGSGTIPIEAALFAAGAAPGMRGRFGFESWPDHDAEAWEKERGEARRRFTVPRKVRVVGFDRDPERVAEARENAEAAGVGEWVEFEVADACNFSPRPGWNAWIVSNLPYGERIGRDADIEGLYERFGDALRASCAGYRVALLGPKSSVTRKLGLRSPEAFELLNGGIDCRVLVAEVAV